MIPIQSTSDTLLSIARSCSRACVRSLHQQHVSSNSSILRAYVHFTLLTPSHACTFSHNQNASTRAPFILLLQRQSERRDRALHSHATGQPRRRRIGSQGRRWTVENAELAAGCDIWHVCVVRESPSTAASWSTVLPSVSSAVHVLHCVCKLRDVRFRLVHSVKSAQKR
jgi:hypothetical protein